MVEIRPCRDDADERVSLEIYNAVWPALAITMAEVESFKTAMRDYGDHLALVAGEAVGAAAVAISPTQPDVGLAYVTVLAERRGQGAGTMLYAAASRWLAERGIEELDAPVPEDDERSLAWARRRGFREVERDSRLVLDLPASEPPSLDPRRESRSFPGRGGRNSRGASTRWHARRIPTSRTIATERWNRSRTGSSMTSTDRTSRRPRPSLRSPATR
jgi:GNAT superfamily N-acetyltransferase